MHILILLLFNSGYSSVAPNTVIHLSLNLGTRSSRYPSEMCTINDICPLSEFFHPFVNVPVLVRV
jgi:hypothetical protein